MEYDSDNSPQKAHCCHFTKKIKEIYPDGYKKKCPLSCPTSQITHLHPCYWWISKQLPPCRLDCLFLALLFSWHLHLLLGGGWLWDLFCHLMDEKNQLQLVTRGENLRYIFMPFSLKSDCDSRIFFSTESFRDIEEHNNICVQECIPVGCVPPAHWPWGVYLPGGSAQVLPPWTEFSTHATENITLSQLRCGR